MAFILNRSKTFNILEKIPNEVLSAIVYTCGSKVTPEEVSKKREEVIKFVREFNSSQINSDLNSLDKPGDYEKIAIFNGGKGRWTKESIVEAFKLIIQFNKNPIIDFDNFNIGFKDSRNIKNYDPIMIYQYCVCKQIPVKIDDTVDHMVEKIMNHSGQKEEEERKHKLETERKQEEFEEFRKKQEEEIRKKIFEEAEEERLAEEKKLEAEREAEKEKLEEEQKIEDARRIEEEKREAEERIKRKEEEFLKREADLLKRESELLLKKEVETAPTNIANLNLSNLQLRFFKNFHLLKKEDVARLFSNIKEVDLKLKSSFKPSDINTDFITSRSVLTRDESIAYAIKFLNFDLRMSANAQEDLIALSLAEKNETIYEPKVKGNSFDRYLKLNKNIFNLDFYWIPSLESIYPNKTSKTLIMNQRVKNLEELKEIYSKPNFHQGWVCGAGEELTHFDNIPLSGLKRSLLFSFGVPGGTAICFTLKEYLKFLRKEGYPRNPLNSSPLEDCMINRLKNMSRDFLHNEDFDELLRFISETEKNIIKTNDIETRFLQKYLDSADSIDFIISDIYKLAMYIRGWRIGGKQDFPVNKHLIVSYEDYSQEIEENVIKTTTRLTNYLNSLDPKVVEVIKNLPVISYDVKDRKFVPEEETVWGLVETLSKIREVVFVGILGKSLKLATSAHYYNFKATRNKICDIDTLCA
jgi:hypothetical protein